MNTPARWIPSLLILTLISCTQTTTIKTNPLGSKVWIDGTFAGVTPLQYSIGDGIGASRGPLKYRMERAGHEPLEGKLQTRVSGGRITGGIFTVGILFLFRSPVVLQSEYEFALYPSGTTRSEISQDWVASVRELDQLHKDGLLTDQEYSRRRAILMRDMDHGTGDQPDKY